MPVSRRPMWPLLVLFTALAVVLLLAAPARALTLNDVSATVMGPGWSWLVVPALIAALLLFSWVCHRGATYADESLHASRVARLFDTLGSQADGIAGLLLAHPPAAQAALQIVRQAAIAQGVAYARANLPDTIKAIGVSDDVLAARLDNAVTGKLLGLPQAADVTADLTGAAQAALLTGLAGFVPQPAPAAA